jgi:hypothetical protein
MVLIGHQKTENRLRKSAQEAQKMAMMALTSASELGQVIQFVEFIAHINTMNLLANQVLMTCNSIALNCVLSIERETTKLCGTATGLISVHLRNR